MRILMMFGEFSSETKRTPSFVVVAAVYVCALRPHNFSLRNLHFRGRPQHVLFRFIYSLFSFFYFILFYFTLFTYDSIALIASHAFPCTMINSYACVRVWLWPHNVIHVIRVREQMQFLQQRKQPFSRRFSVCACVRVSARGKWLTNSFSICQNVGIFESLSMCYGLCAFRLLCISVRMSRKYKLKQKMKHRVHGKSDRSSILKSHSA